MKKYTIKAFEEELGNNYYQVLVPKETKEADVLKAFKMAEKYALDNCDYWIYAKDESIEDGIKEYDEHYEQMLEVSEGHRLDVFCYYISECCGWEITEFEHKYNFKFEW